MVCVWTEPTPPVDYPEPIQDNTGDMLQHSFFILFSGMVDITQLRKSRLKTQTLSEITSNVRRYRKPSPEPGCC